MRAKAEMPDHGRPRVPGPPPKDALQPKIAAVARREALRDGLRLTIQPGHIAKLPDLRRSARHLPSLSRGEPRITASRLDASRTARARMKYSINLDDVTTTTRAIALAR